METLRGSSPPINGDFEGKKGRKKYPATFLQTQINGDFEGK